MQAVELSARIMKIGNENALSDAGVAAITAHAAAKGAFYNIKINMPGITDETFVEEVSTKAERLVEKIGSICSEVEAALKEVLR